MDYKFNKHEKEYLEYIFSSINCSLGEIKDKEVANGLIRDLTLLKNFLGTDAQPYCAKNNVDMSNIKPELKQR